MAILALAAFLRLYQLGAESYSYDEGILVDATGSGWSEVSANISRGRPPLMVLLGFIWINLFGTSELVVRLLPAFMGIFSVWLLYWIGRSLFEVKVGLLAAAIMSISAFHIFHSQDYRYYSLLTMTALLSTAFYIKFLQSGGRRAAVPYIICSVLVYYAHYQGLFFLVAQGLFFLTRWPRASNLCRWRWFGAQCVIGLAILPSLFKIYGDFTSAANSGEFAGSIGAMGQLGPLSDPEFWLPFHTLLIKYYFISVDNLLALPSLGLSLLLMGIGVLYLKVWPRRGGGSLPQNETSSAGVALLNFRSAVLLVLLWMICPIFIPFILSKLFGPMYLPRYTIAALPAVSLSMGLAMFVLRTAIPLWASFGALAILVSPVLQNYYITDFKEQWQAAATYLSEQQREDDHLIFASVNNESADRIQRIFLRYLARFTNISGTRMDASCVVSAGLTPPGSIREQLLPCLEKGRRTWIVSRPAKPGPQLAVENELLAAIPEGWSGIEEEHFGGIVLRLYEQR